MSLQTTLRTYHLSETYRVYSSSVFPATMAHRSEADCISSNPIKHELKASLIALELKCNKLGISAYLDAATQVERWIVEGAPGME